MKTIDCLRFPLIVGVVLIHSYNEPTTEIENYTIFNNVQYFISQVLARIAVPLFFFISGFLFFYNVKNWNYETYKYKLNRRFKSLIIPYLFWISLAIIVFFVAQNIPVLSPFFSEKNKLLKDYTFSEFIKLYWSMASFSEAGNRPFLHPFWFLRDLIVIVFLSPIVYYFVKYLKLFGITILFILWSINAFEVTGLSLPCLFFFTSGAYLSIYNFDLPNIFKKFSYLGIFYPIIALIDTATRNYNFNLYIHNIGIILGIILLFNSTSYLLKHNRIRIIPLLSNVSFFIFATHEPSLRELRKLLIFSIKPTTELTYFIIYFTPAIFIILISILVYILMNKICPKFLNIISGGR